MKVTNEARATNSDDHTDAKANRENRRYQAGECQMNSGLVSNVTIGSEQQTM